MKKSVIKRRKRVVPAATELETSHLHHHSFAISPSPPPQQLDNQNPIKSRLGSSIDHHGPPDLRLSPHFNDAPTAPNDRKVSSATHSNHPTDIDSRNQHPLIDPHYKYEAPPIGVDFTGYQLDNRKRRLSSHPHQNSQPPNQLPPVSSLDPITVPSDNELHSRLSPFPPSRKRSHSNTEHSSPSPPTGHNHDRPPPRLSSISSILNAPQQNSTLEEVPMDSHHSTLPPQLRQHRHSTPLSHQHYYPQQQQHQSGPQGQMLPQREKLRQSTSSDPGGWELMDKKARLRREAEQMRELLKSKERELEELERNGA
ncbi:MAG: hypothetical protein Q9163_001792 [Psora crenata]